LAAQVGFVDAFVLASIAQTGAETLAWRNA
jgi:hypothetical protein